MPAADGPIRVRKKTAPKKAPAAVKPQGVFGGLKPATAPITRAQGQARQKVRKATQKVERNVQVPVTPKLANPTRQQRSAAQTQVAKSLHRQGITTRQQVAALPKSQQKRVHRAEGYARTNTRRNPNFVRDTVKKGDLHSRLHFAGATIDPTPLGHAIGDALKGNPISATVKGGESLLHGFGHAGATLVKGHGIPANALRDAIDLPANAVASVYKVAHDAVTGKEFLYKDLAKPIIDTVEHPVKSFEQHPLNTLLIARGIKGGIGHGAGKIMRTGKVGEVAKRVASTARPSKEVPGAQAEVRQQYSKDPSSKAVQIGVEKARRARAVKKGRPDPTRVASEKDIRQSINEDVAAEKIVSGQHVAETGHKAADAIGYTSRKARRKAGVEKPTAATNLAAQGITNVSPTDLAKYLKEIRARAPKLAKKGDQGAIKANQRTQALIEDALKNHDPVSVDKAVRAYSTLRQGLEQQLLAENVVKGGAATAEQARLEGVRVRRVKSGSQPQTRIVRKQANKALKQARIEASRAKAALATAKAEATAARTGAGKVPVAVADSVVKAQARHDGAQVALEQAKLDQHTAAAAHIRAHMDPGQPEPAFVSHQPVPIRGAAIKVARPRVASSEMRTGAAIRNGTLDVHPAKLVEQAQQTQRLIDQAQARSRLIDRWGYRGSGDRQQPVQTFKTVKGAEAFAKDKLKAKTGLDWKAIKQQDGSQALIPAHAHDQLVQFEKNVDGRHPLMKAAGAQWRRNVLAFSPRWLAGNVVEAAMRSMVAGAGPASYATAHNALKELTPAEREIALARTVGGGQYNVTNRIAHERNIARDAESLSGMAHAVQRLGKTRTARALSVVYERYTNVVFRAVNGRLENVAQTAMLGKALRAHPLMSEHTVKLAGQAVQDAANGLRDTNTLVELGRQVDRMYGQYGKFSPELQGMIANYTPFISWTLNATNFLYHVLPADHPVLTGLLASANTATESWRKQHGLYLDVFGAKSTKGQLPGWLQGSIPGKAGSHLRVSRYTPFGILDAEGAPIVGQLSGLLLPQLSEATANWNGNDFTGKKSLSPVDIPAKDALAGVVSIIEGQVPLASQITRVTGARLPNMSYSTKVSPKVVTRLGEQFNPAQWTPAKKPTVRKSASSGGITWGDSGSGVTWGDKSSGVTWGG